MSSTTDVAWDGALYQRISGPQTAWGERVLARLALRGDERVLDAGCGSGKLTASLLARLPTGSVLALDNSASMLAEAKKTLAAYGERVAFAEGDLLALALPPAERVDVIFSTATFHWVLDHDALFGRLFEALKPGGRLLAQCGGEGNLRALYGLAAVARQAPERAPFFAGFREPLLFAGPRETAERLARAGFVDIETGLEDAPTPFADPASFRRFVANVCLRHDLEALPVALREGYLDAITALAAAATPPSSLDYVRLNLSARKPG